jgi:hypothetical protein
MGVEQVLEEIMENTKNDQTKDLIGDLLDVHFKGKDLEFD